MNSDVQVPIGDLVSRCTVKVEVTGIREFTWRMRIMQALLKMAARISPITMDVEMHQ